MITKNHKYYGDFTKKVKKQLDGISGKTVPTDFIRNYIIVKKIYARTNSRAGKLNKINAVAIEQACDFFLEFADSELQGIFDLDLIQPGGGTGTNMLVNEVLAAKATEILQENNESSNLSVHPNDHVNMSQSTNDTFPGVSRITALYSLRELQKMLGKLQKSITEVSQSWNYQKVGRTHFQDAVPMLLKDEFAAFARTIEKNINNLQPHETTLRELNFGATAIGSLQNIDKNLRKRIVIAISEHYSENFTAANNYFEITSSSGDFARLSSDLNNLATDLIKICTDLRILASGPRAGLNEINIKPTQPGSSIMPGKVNPTIPEMLEMICFTVIGSDQTVQIATRHSSLQLQIFAPMVTFPLLDSLQILSRGVNLFDSCIKTITANTDQIERNLENSFVYATDYTDKLGYDRVAELVKEALKNDIPLRKLLEKEIEKHN